MNILQIKSSLFGDDGQSSRLAKDPVPHLDPARFAAFTAQKHSRTGEQDAVIAYSDRLVDELRRASLLVLGLPMYNFGVPTQLKAWYDHVARAGITFRYTAKGPEGLLTGKKAYIFATRGGAYAGGSDWQGLAISEHRRHASLAEARSALRKLVPDNRRAA